MKSIVCILLLSYGVELSVDGLTQTDAQVAQVQQRLATAEGRARIEAIAELLTLARDEPVEEIDALGEEALRWLADHPDGELERSIRVDLSWYEAHRSGSEAALEHARRAADLADAAKDPVARADADYHIAVAYWFAGDVDDTLRFAERARDAQRALGRRAELATTLTLIGAAHRSQSAVGAALDSHLEALAIAESLEDEVAIARSKNNIALIHWAVDEHERARAYLEDVVPVYRRIQSDRRLATVLSNLGLIYTEQHEPKLALPVLAEALELHRRLGLRHAEAKVLNNLSFAHEALGDDATALDYATQALVLREELGDDWGLARVLGSIASIHARSGRISEAAAMYERGAACAERAGAREELASILQAWSEVCTELGKHDEALAHLRRHVEIVAELDHDETAQRIAELEAQVALDAQEKEHESRRQSQQLEIEQARMRQTFFGFATIVLLLGSVTLFLLYRSRERTLGELRRKHEELSEVTGRLRESEQRYRSAFEDAVLPKLLVDLDDARVVDANGPAERLCEREADELRGLAFSRLEPAWLARALVAMEVDETSRVEEWGDTGGKVHAAELWSSPVQLGGRACAVVTVRDVTEVRKADEERIRVDKLESLGLLAGGIAHDFNNALAGILGYVSLARLESRVEEIEPLLLEAEMGVDHAKHLTTQLLTFSKGGEPQLRLESVRALLWDAVHFALSGSNVRVEFDLDPRLWAAELDAGQFKQAVNNLVINAVQAMPNGGRLAVSARNFRAREELGPNAAPGPYVRIDFQDEGDGIAADIRDKVLDPYFTTKDLGSGLGLATVFAVASRHDGWLEFESVEGAGATFSLYFPASAERLPDGEEEPDVELTGSGRILVMDDDPLLQRVFAAALSELGYEAQIVGDGADALEAWFEAKRAGQPFDAVLMDLTIPGGMGGKVAMGELRRRDPGALGIVVSGYSKDPVMSNYREAGFAASLSKPFNVAGLGRLLSKVLQARPQRSGGVSRRGSESRS